MQYFEDIHVGEPQESDARYTFTADGIIAFASAWDPMPFHVDEELAKRTPIGALFASSAHTMSVGIKLAHSLIREDVAVIAALGWNDVRFPVPVLAGDTLRICSEVIEKRESESRSDRGIIVSRSRLFNQRNEIVAEYKISGLFQRRP